MNFIDKTTVYVHAGDGGSGKVSFRHEKYIDKGGPDGGDAGHGGDVIFVASRNQNTLAAFRYQRELTAEPGQNGGSNNRHGRNGAPLRVDVPVGTIILSADESKVIGDLTEDGQEVVVARGGKGGFGNAHFTSSRRQAPNFAEKGLPGDEFDAVLELKMIADVGLVGLPNAGKSTLLGRISNARPEVANYPFTTLKPHLGVVDMEGGNSLLVADIPGLIEGAAEGKGLGHEFLRHVERTAVILHLVDAYQDDIAAAYQTIESELAAYSDTLSGKPRVVAINKVDGLDQEIIDDLIAQIRAVAPAKTDFFAISAAAGTGITPLLRRLQTIVHTVRAEAQAVQDDDTDALPVLRLSTAEDQPWRVEFENGRYLVTGPKIEAFAGRTEFTNEEAVQRLRAIMRKMGITHALQRQGIEPGQTIQFGSIGSIEY